MGWLQRGLSGQAAKRHACVLVWCLTLGLLGSPGPDPQTGFFILAASWVATTAIRVRLSPPGLLAMQDVAAQVSMGFAMSVCWASQALCLGTGTPHLLSHAVLMMSLPTLVALVFKSARTSLLRYGGLSCLSFGLAALNQDAVSVAIALALVAWGLMGHGAPPRRAVTPTTLLAWSLMGPSLLAICALCRADPTQILGVGLGLSLLLALARQAPDSRRHTGPLPQIQHGLRP